jgi:hypothetical protein
MSYDLLEAWEVLPTGTFAPVGYGWSFGSTPEIVAGQQRSGTRCMFMSGVADFATFPLSNTNEKIAGFAWKYTTSPSDVARANPIAYFTFASSSPVWIRLNGSSRLSIMFGTTQLASGTTVLNVSTYYFIELHVNRSTGNVNVYLNFDGVGSPVAEVSANVGALTTFATFRLGWFNTISSSSNTDNYIDDIYVFNGSQPFGDSAVLYRFPVSNNTPQNWVPSSGNAWDRIDNVPLDPAQYIEAAAANDKSNFNFAGFSQTIYQVYATQVVTNWLRTGATAETAQQGFNIGGTDYYAPPRTVPQTTAEWVRDIFQLNPATTSQWLPSEIQTGSVGSLFRAT